MCIRDRVRSNGENRFVNLFMEIVMRQDDKTHYIFMAPYISEQSARAMKEDVYKRQLVDTAGRLHNKKNLMEELRKMNRIIDKEFPNAHRENLICLLYTSRCV